MASLYYDDVMLWAVVSVEKWLPAYGNASQQQQQQYTQKKEMKSIHKNVAKHLTIKIFARFYPHKIHLGPNLIMRWFEILDKCESEWVSEWLSEWVSECVCV